MSAAAADYAIAIVGGGLVGASLALALAPLGLRIAVIEAVPRGEPEQPSFDERTTALANGSVRTFMTLGVWSGMERDATPIRRLHVSEQGRFGVARIDAAEQGLPAIGYVVPNWAIGRGIVAALEATPAIEVLAPARVVGTELVADRRYLEIETTEGAQTLTAQLVVAADGAHSMLRNLSGVGAEHWDYEQTAIVTTVTTQRFHDHVAYERFTPDGPIAVLPLRDGRCGLVWTRRPDEAARVLALDGPEFIGELQDAFGMRLGRFVQVGKLQGYELALTRAERHTAPRLAIVGNAAQGLHPIAGQGFNLGLRDAASLAEVIATVRASSAADAGAESVLRAYAEWRDEDRRRIVAFTDGLVRIFGSPLALVRGLRGLGLLAFDALPPAKDALSRLSVGAAGRVPRLARGVPLVSRDH
jgi:2-octaprenyl-6-methoxyphenol hydroxylase